MRNIQLMTKLHRAQNLMENLRADILGRVPLDSPFVQTLKHFALTMLQYQINLPMRVNGIIHLHNVRVTLFQDAIDCIETLRYDC